MLRPAAVLLALLAAGLAGCLAPAPAPLGQAPPVVWEGPLAMSLAVPEVAPTRSDAARRADVAPPGDPRFAAFDEAMRRFMASHQVPAATVAVLADGRLRYEQGYGFLDPEGTQPTPPDAMFRLASVTKPMTAALTALLVEEGRMAWDQPVFCLPPTPASGCLLPLAPHPLRPVTDERLADVTLRDLVVHQTGWTRRTCTDLFVSPQLVAVAHGFGVPTPPPAWRVAQYFMGYPMEFDPGADPDAGPLREYDTYCNMGYILLGLIAEARTGATLAALYDAYLFRPLEVAGHVAPGHTLPERRDPREPAYACDGGLVTSVFDPTREVCWADGGFDLDGILAAGGLVGTAAAVGAVYEVFWNDGRLREAGPVTYSDHGGSLPGTGTTAARYTLPGVGDVQFVVLFNKDTGHEDLPSAAARQDEYQVLHGALLAAYASAEARLP